ncbi:MAG: glycosyltransferase family 1 protein, partial [bacterium]
MVIGIDTSRAYIRDKTGTENYSYHLINALLRLPESREHTFVLFTRPNPILPSEIGGYSNVIVREVKWKHLWTQIGLAWETWKEPRIDVLWIPAHTLPVLRNPRIKTVVTIHGLEYQWLPEYKNWLQRWYLPLSTIYATKAADQLIAVSKFTAKQLKKELHTSSKKIKVIHEGVELDRRSSIVDGRRTLEKYGLQQKRYLLFVGSLQPRKNLVTLIEAFSLVGARFPDYKLVLAGGVGWMAEEILSAPTRFGVQDKVVFTGRVSDQDLQSLYGGSVIYIQPSITEGFGLPILEAMSAGVPVISSDGGALPEVVGEAGIIVNLKSQMTNSQ